MTNYASWVYNKTVEKELKAMTTITWFTLIMSRLGFTVSHDGGDHEIFQVYDRQGELFMTVWCENGYITEGEMD